MASGFFVLFRFLYVQMCVCLHLFVFLVLLLLCWLCCLVVLSYFNMFVFILFYFIIIPWLLICFLIWDRMGADTDKSSRRNRTSIQNILPEENIFWIIIKNAGCSVFPAWHLMKPGDVKYILKSLTWRQVGKNQSFLLVWAAITRWYPHLG